MYLLTSLARPLSEIWPRKIRKRMFAPTVVFTKNFASILPYQPISHVEHYELEHQSVGQKRLYILHSWNAVSTKMALFGCSIWRWKTCKASFGWVFGFQLDLLEKNLFTLLGFTFSQYELTKNQHKTIGKKSSYFTII